MRVFFLRSNPVAPDPRVEKEVDALLKSGHLVKILAWNRTTEQAKEEVLKFLSGDVLVTRFNLKAGFGSGIKTIFRLIGFQIFLIFQLVKNRKDIDIIHAADFDTVIPAVLMKLFFKKRVVYDIYDFYVDAFYVPRFIKPIIKKIDLFIISYVDVVIITNESRIEQISGSKPRKLFVIHNTPQEKNFLVKSMCVENKMVYKPSLTLTYVGILQNHRLIIELLNVFKRHSDWTLHIAGFGSLESKVRIYSETCKNINFYGRVTYDKSIKLSSLADVLIATYDPLIPNHKYTSPNKLYEAMMLKKPLIVCLGTGIDKIVLESSIGFVIDYNEFDLELCLEKIVHQIDMIEVMGLRARKLYDETYSWQIMEEKLMFIYDGFIDPEY